MAYVRDEKHNHGKSVQTALVSYVEPVIFEYLLHEYDDCME